jgi:signal transduction histidine kinase/ActR/RegA family two-component response regulator
MVSVTVAIILMVSCSQNTAPALQTTGAVNPFPTFRDVPGITAEEIAAIEALQREYSSFIYGGNPTTETFINNNGEISGFTALLCVYLSDLFGIPFKPQVFTWPALLSGLNNRSIDFMGSLTATPERLQIYSMSDPITERQLKMMRIWGSPPMEQIAKQRLPRYALVRVSNIRNLVIAAMVPGTFEVVDVGDIDEAYQALLNGRADAYIEVNTTVDAYPAPDVYSESFFPLIFTQASLTTANHAFRPIMSVLDKALQNGARTYINYLNNLGYEEYKIERFRSQLTDEEKAYLQNPSPVLLATGYYNYPVAFYNNYEREWQGITFDVLAEVEKFTGLTFTVANNENTEYAVLMQMLKDGSVHMFPGHPYTASQEDEFLWANNSFITDQFALLSKVEYPNIILSDISDARVGMVAGSFHAGLFRLWFPVASNTREYESDASAFRALDRGEVNLIMSSKNRLLSALNYYELPNYKVNFLFNRSETPFVFNKNQEILRSIVDKAIPLIDTNTIAEQWLSKTYDYRAKVAEGRIPWLIGAVSLAFMALLASILFIRGRGEGKRLAVLVKEKTREATEASEAKSRFISTMTHELRTPMNSIIGFSELAINDNLPAETKDYLNKIMLNSDLLLQIINDVLDISKIEAGKMELEYIPFDLHELLTACQTIIMPRATEKEVNLYFYAEPSIDRKLIGDSLRLRQVILNLLSNAVKFTSKNGVIKILATFINAGKVTDTDGKVTDTITIHFEVKDSGIGMSPEQLAKISQPFIQAETDTSRKYGGTGLGLAISKNIIEMMGGSLKIESMLGVGSKFSFDIIFATMKLDGDAFGDKALPDSTVDNSRLKGEILLCEDNKMNQQVFIENLKRVGLNADIAENGREGFNMVRRRHEKGEKPYDIIFMDIHMPVMDGLEASALITELNTGTPIIAMTANVMSHDKDLYEKNGMKDSVTKPFKTHELMACLTKYLGEE